MEGDTRLRERILIFFLSEIAVIFLIFSFHFLGKALCAQQGNLNYVRPLPSLMDSRAYLTSQRIELPTATTSCGKREKPFFRLRERGRQGGGQKIH